MRLETLRAGKNANHDDIQKLSFTYDNVGNVLSITDALNANQTQTFGYDWLNRLTSAATNAAGTGQYNHSYSYDAIGNITVKDGQSYTYGSGKPHAVTAAQGNSYGYDGNGNMITRVIAGVTYTLSYDYENRLIEVKQDATVMATFLYDADGNRVKGTVSGATTVYIAGVYEWQSGASTSYYEGPTGIIALRRAGHASDNGVKYLLSDHLGSTGVLVNQDGSVAARNYYHPYGDNRDGPFSALTTKRFTGQYHEEALGLYFYNARWYDPALGRFTQADTLIPSPANPQAFNRYAYTLNNPVRFTDPTGHCIPDYNCPGDIGQNDPNQGGTWTPRIRPERVPTPPRKKPKGTPTPPRKSATLSRNSRQSFGLTFPNLWGLYPRTGLNFWDFSLKYEFSIWFATVEFSASTAQGGRTTDPSALLIEPGKLSIKNGPVRAGLTTEGDIFQSISLPKVYVSTRTFYHGASAVDAKPSWPVSKLSLSGAVVSVNSSVRPIEIRGTAKVRLSIEYRVDRYAQVGITLIGWYFGQQYTAPAPVPTFR